MAATHYYDYHETVESRELREEFNRSRTGHPGDFTDPSTRIQMPTAAGSAMLDVGKLGSDGSSSGAEAVLQRRSLGWPNAAAKDEKPPPRKERGLASWGGKGGGGDPSKGARMFRRSKDPNDANAASDDESTPPFKRKGVQAHFANAAPVGGLFIKPVDEDDVPPLTAEDAKARATRTAMLIEYAHRHEYGKDSRPNESKYDIVLSA